MRRRDDEASSDEATDLPGTGSGAPGAPRVDDARAESPWDGGAPPLVLRADGVVEGLGAAQRARAAGPGPGFLESPRFGAPGADEPLELATEAAEPGDAGAPPEPAPCEPAEPAPPAWEEAAPAEPPPATRPALRVALRRAAWLLAAGGVFAAGLWWYGRGASAPNHPDAPSAVRTPTPLEEALGVATDVPLVVVTTPPGATLRLNGREVGVTPWAGGSPGGASLELELELAGYQLHRRRVDGRQELHLDVTLVRR